MLVAKTSEIKRWDIEFEQDTGLPGLILMEQAAMGLAQVCIREYRNGVEHFGDTGFIIFCGSGMNGGDGYALARILKSADKDIPVNICEADPDKTRRGDALRNRDACIRMGIDFILLSEIKNKIISYSTGANQNQSSSIGQCIFVDAVFGTGFDVSREMSESAKNVLDFLMKIHRLGGKIIAADIPSGVASDTGKISEYAVFADITVTFGVAKQGLFLGEGRKCSGKVELAPLTYPALINTDSKSEFAGIVPGEKTLMSLLAKRTPYGHKGTFGSVGIIAGSDGMIGAGILATMAAVASGAGKVFSLVPSGAVSAYLTHSPSAIVVGRDSRDARLDINKFLNELKLGACLFGSGLPEDENTLVQLEELLRWGGRIILDAAAISLMANNKERLQPQFLRRSSSKMPRPLITPHVAEFRRLMGECSGTDTISDILKISKEWDVTILYKDSVSIVADYKEGSFPTVFSYEKIDLYQSKELCSVYLPFGNSSLARGGSGDILAGLISGLLAASDNVAETAVASAYICGKSAELAAELAGAKSLRSLSPQEQIECIKKIFINIDNI